MSWGGSHGDFDVLWEHTQTRWGYIARTVASFGLHVGGRVLEFGAGLGLFDDVLDDTCTALVMLDHTDRYIRERPHPLRPRCRHVRWNEDTVATLAADEAPFDWLVSIAVFYHLDDATAIALIRELGQLLRPGGHVLIEGWNSVRDIGELAVRTRLFSRYPNYVLNEDVMRDALAPEFQELRQHGVLLYRKEG